MSDFHIEKVKIEEKVFFGERVKCTKEELPSVFGRILPKAYGFLLGEKKVNPSDAGAPSALYFEFNPEVIDVMVGFSLSESVAETLQEENGFTKHPVRGGSYLKVTCIGPYDKIAHAWGAGMKHMDLNSLAKDDCYLGMEAYVNDPSTVKPEELQTDIYFKINEKRKRKEPIAHGGFCHIDIFYEDKDRVKKFYGDLFGWTFADYLKDYIMFTSPSGMDGGLEKRTIQSVQSCIPYIMVETFDQDFKAKLESVGGNIVGEPTIFEGMGGYYPIQDSEGNFLSLFSYNLTKF